MSKLKKTLKILAVLLVVVLVAGAALFVHVWYFKPFDINLLFARTAAQFVLESPELLSTLRVLEPLGIDYHNDDLDDASIAAGDRTFARVRRAREVLLSYDDAKLDANDARSKEIMLWLLDLAVEAERFRFHFYPVNQLWGVQSDFPTFMEDIHQVDDVGDAEDYVARLSKVGVKFDQVIEGLRHREKLGLLPPRFVVDKVLEQMDGFVTTPVEEGILYAGLVAKMEKAEIEEADRERLATAARAEIEGTVYPAYERLIAYFREIDPKVEGSHGAWSLPDGDELYRLALRFFTTTDLSPQKIHDMGLTEVQRLQEEMLASLAAAGRDVSGGFEATMTALNEDPAFYYPDTEEGREAILRDYQAILDEIDAGLDEAFDIRPEAALEVKREAEFKEKTATMAHYEMPSMDGSRPGLFVVSLYDLEMHPKYVMRTLAYHEGIPGHHFQLALQMEQENLPFFRRLAPFIAFSEGWALYAEQLAWELGFQDDPYDNVGRLQAELFRAVRLVVDTGIHHARWNREQAIDYVLANTGMAESEVVVEVERYFVMPGQACAYKVGMMKILELRERARNELGDAFDLRDFHRIVLTSGSVPLTLLERQVDEYVAEAKGRQGKVATSGA
jgi:uncharacterized protein (DUF885 family)